MNERYVLLVSTDPHLPESTRELATRLARDTQSVLLFLHVVPLRISDGEAMLSQILRHTAGSEDAWLHRQRPTDPGVPFRHRYAVGDPEDLVHHFVASHDVAFVLAEEGPRARLSEALTRGLAERLARRLPCPVVLPGVTATPAPAPGLQRRGGLPVADLLNATVEARVAALRTWMDAMARGVARIAASPTVTDVARLAERGWLPRRRRERLDVELEEHRRALQALGWRLITDGHVVSDGVPPPDEGPALAEFLERVHRLGASTSLPLRAGLDEVVVLAGARVPGTSGLLWMHLPARADFLRILGQPGPLPTFETYAFDTSGLMLSNSRFPDHLVAAGLLQADGQQTPLRLRIAEPSEGPTTQWPLTRMAQQAALHHVDGFDTRGYPDYRGTPVVGAWRWVDDYGFGVAAEVDRDAAYA